MSTAGSVLTIGKFDGVHRGHLHLAEATRRLAAELSARALAVVLHPHPATVLAGAHVPLLTTIAERRALLGPDGPGQLDDVAVLTFDLELAGLEPTAFLDLLADRFGLAGLVVGPDFKFGRQRAGDVAFLRDAGEKRGFALRVVEPLEVDGHRAGSGRIREAIAAGDIGAARSLLGRPPHLRGRVVTGARRGRTIGYPTANLEPLADYVVPADGVYAVHVRRTCATAALCGAASIGVRPTFDDGPRSIEVFILDFDGDLYGEELTVDWLAWLRDEERFDSVDQLLTAMALDVQRARDICAAEHQ